MAPSKAEVAKGWIAYWSRSDKDRKATEADEVYVLNDLSREQPELCWEVILEIVRSIEPDPATTPFQVLAAGPLEDLLTQHGDAFIDRVEAQAKRDPHFKLLLGGVWQNAMSNTIWARLQKCRDPAW